MRRGRFASGFVCVVVAAASVSMPAVVSAAPGDLDPSFSDDGRVVIEPAARPRSRAVAVFSLKDGGAIAFGTSSGSPVDRSSTEPKATFVRFTRSGKLNRTFGRYGVRRSESFMVAYGAIRMPDGKFVVWGDGPRYLPSIARYSKGGRVDRTFSDDGSLTYDPRTELADVLSVEAQRDGSIVALLSLRNSSSEEHYPAILRLDRWGQPDPSFGNDGVVIPSVPEAGPPLDLALTADDRILVAGAYALFRLTPDGAPDVSFGGGGVTREPLGLFPHVVETSKDGDIVMASTRGKPARFQVGQLTPAGGVDRTFGNAGISEVRLRSEGGIYGPPEMFVGRRGIVVAGDSYEHRIAVSSFESDGTPERAFGIAGRNILTYGYGNDDADTDRDLVNDLSVDSSGRVLVAGAAENEDYEDSRFALSRLAVGGRPDADADGLRDRNDRCPFLYANSGCPALRRNFAEVEYDRKRRFFVGRLESIHRECLDGRVVVFDVGGERERRVGRGRADADFEIPMFPTPGRYQARVGRDRDPNRGICTAARSRVVEIR